jgi:hypothetical protein
VISQVLIVLWWKDARFGTIANVLLLAPIVVALAGVWPGGAASQFRRLAAEGFARHAAPPPVTDADLAPLPAPVQRYLRFAGVVGKPRVLNFRARFQGTIAGARNAGAAPFRATQVSFLDRPTRLFLLESARAGVPFDAFHVFAAPTATMRVKIASLFTVVDARGPEMDQSETVTMFNDMCLLAPASLIDPRIRWFSSGEDRVDATFELGGHTVHATLRFGPNGELVDFVSQDRYQTSDGKAFVRYPWSTPVSRCHQLEVSASACLRSALSRSPHLRALIRMNSGTSSPWRTGWSPRIAAQPRWVTVTRVPDGDGANSTSTVVTSPAAKFDPRQVKASRAGGSQTVIVPAVKTWVWPPSVKDSNTRPPRPGSRWSTPGR